jgi:D-alanyl-D-alanine carboxypeptidase (penicillin-binding protein 5/6)
MSRKIWLKFILLVLLSYIYFMGIIRHTIERGIVLKRFKRTIACVLLLLLIFVNNLVIADDICENQPFLETLTKLEYLKKAPAVNAMSAVAIDLETGRVLFEKNAYSKMAMASTTKIMTAIVAVENGDIKDVVTVSKRAASIRGSVLGLHEGKKVTLEELLYGLMLCSGNDAAIAVAEHIGSSVEQFADMMTKKAYIVGARNTGFKTPHGLDSDGHYSTAYDMAIIARYALENPLISKIVKTKYIQTSMGTFYNTNEMLDIYPGADGVKTGYTGKAGRCLVTSVTRDDRRVITVVLGCPTRAARAQSSRDILDYVFANYKNYTLQTEGTNVKMLPVERGIVDRVEIKTVENFVLPLKEGELGLIEKRIYLPERLDAPVIAGADAGFIQILLDGEIIAQSPLKICSDVRRKVYLDYLGDVIKQWCKIMQMDKYQ